MKTAIKEDRAWTAKDKQKAAESVRGLHQVYLEKLYTAQLEYNQLQRKVNQVNHEIRRLERHLGRMTDFCTKHNISLESGGEK